MVQIVHNCEISSSHPCWSCTTYKAALSSKLGSRITHGRTASHPWLAESLPWSAMANMRHCPWTCPKVYHHVYWLDNVSQITHDLHGTNWTQSSMGPKCVCAPWQQQTHTYSLCKLQSKYHLLIFSHNEFKYNTSVETCLCVPLAYGTPSQW